MYLCYCRAFSVIDIIETRTISHANNYSNNPAVEWHFIKKIGQLTVSIAEHFIQPFSAYVVIKRQLSVISLLINVLTTDPVSLSVFRVLTCSYLY